MGLGCRGRPWFERNHPGGLVRVSCSFPLFLLCPAVLADAEL